jgi:hypothetical protein
MRPVTFITSPTLPLETDALLGLPPKMSRDAMMKEANCPEKVVFYHGCPSLQGWGCYPAYADGVLSKCRLLLGGTGHLLEHQLCVRDLVVCNTSSKGTGDQSGCLACPQGEATTQGSHARRCPRFVTGREMSDNREHLDQEGHI